MNVLLALLHTAHVHHERAHAWVATVGELATCSITELGLIRLAINPGVLDPPLSSATVLGFLDDVRARPGGHVLWADDIAPGRGVVPIRTHGHVSDAHLVALADRWDGTVMTFDRGLARRASEVGRPELATLVP